MLYESRTHMKYIYLTSCSQWHFILPILMMIRMMILNRRRIRTTSFVLIPACKHTSVCMWLLVKIDVIVVWLIKLYQIMSAWQTDKRTQPWITAYISSQVHLDVFTHACVCVSMYVCMHSASSNNDEMVILLFLDQYTSRSRESRVVAIINTRGTKDKKQNSVLLHSWPENQRWATTLFSWKPHSWCLERLASYQKPLQRSDADPDDENHSCNRRPKWDGC